MPKQPHITIAISTYNVEKYIRDSLLCIINQTIKNIEIICIDDASTDNTLKILNEFKTKDNRIQIISKINNEGLSISRNKALELAKGKYIAFVDGDDLMDLNLFKKAFNLAETNKSDLVIWDHLTFWNSSDIIKLKTEKSILEKISKTDKKALLKLQSFTWLKLIRTNVAKDLNIHFPIGLTKQDIPVHWHLITKINSISILPEKLSYYRQQPEATSYKTDKRLFDVIKIMDITKNFLETNKLYSNYKKIYLNQQLSLFYIIIDTIDNSLKIKATKLINQRLNKEHFDYIYSNNSLPWQINNFYKAKQGKLLNKIMQLFWRVSRATYRIIKKTN